GGAFAAAGCVADDATLAARKAAWKPLHEIPGRGYVSMFAQHVTQADRGCDFDFLHAGPAIPEPEIH
ncbi:MAG: hypothetical protein VW644_08010, partial [Alphaproteobacteria bacterium]